MADESILDTECPSLGFWGVGIGTCSRGEVSGGARAQPTPPPSLPSGIWRASFSSFSVGVVTQYQTRWRKHGVEKYNANLLQKYEEFSDRKNGRKSNNR